MTYAEDLQTPGTKPGFFYGYIVVIAACSIMVAATGTHYAFGVFFKPILTEFGWSRTLISGAFSLSWIVQGLLGILMGGINDRFGPRILLTVCGLLFGLGYLLTSRIDAVWQLYLFYGVIIGIGLGGIYIPLTSTAARWFTKKRNMMTGIILAGMGAGTFIMPPVINQLISAYGWRISCTIMGGLVLIVVVLAAQFLKRDPSKMGLLPYGAKEISDNNYKIKTEGSTPRDAVRTRQFWQVSAMFLCAACCVFGIMVHIAPHATDIGISTTTAATFIATIGGASVIGKVMFGNVADRIGNKRVYIISFILMSSSLVWLMVAGESWMFYLFAIVFGLAYGGCSVSMSPLIATLFGVKAHGLISGLANNGFTTGATIGPTVIGYIFDVTGGYKTAFLACTAIGIVGLILTLLLKPTRVKQE